jgi:hypothetical protein
MRAPVKSDRLLTPEEMLKMEGALCETLSAAMAAYQQAKLNSANLEKIRQDIGEDSPYGKAAVLNALRQQNYCLDRYLETLRVFNDFMLYHRIPQDLPPR